MAEEIKKEEPKIQLSADEFIRAMEEGKAVDVKGGEHDFTIEVEYETRHIYHINNVVVKESIYLTHINPFKNDIKWENCKLNSVDIIGCKFQHSFSIASTSIEKDIFISHTNINRLLIGNSSFKNDIHITNCTLGGTNIVGCSVRNEFVIEDTTINGHLLLNHILNVGKIEISSSQIKKSCSFMNSTIDTDIDINESIIEEELYIIRTIVKNDFIAVNTIINNTIRIHKSILTHLYVPNISLNQILEIVETKFQRILVTDVFNNLGTMKWNNLLAEYNSEIIIETAIMGKWDIVNCDFENLKMVLYSSKITDTFYTNTKFPAKLCPPNDITIFSKQHDILRDGYNQLKTLAQKQNDRKMFLHYQAAELRSYYATLHWYRNFRTWFQLTAMKWSNNFGASWARGIAFVTIVNLLFLTISMSCRSFDLTEAGSFIANYFEFMFSIGSKPKFIDTNWETVWYFISRIFIAFGIYQTVAAFRKFGKSE